MLDNKLYYNALFDCYEALFNEVQKEYFKLYFHEDFSLSEISENLSVSRAAVSKQLKNIKALLDHYESKLRLVKIYDNLDYIVENIETMTKSEIIEKINSIGGE